MAGPSLWRRLPRIKFTLVRMLIAISLLGLMLSYPASLIRQSMNEYARAQELERAGAKVHYQSLGPRWLRAIVGEHRLRVVYWVRLEGIDGADPLVETALSLPNINQLDVHHCEVSDSAFHALPRSRSLRYLTVKHSPVGDEFLGYVAQMHDLERLDVQGTQVSALAIMRSYRSLGKVEFPSFSPLDLGQLYRDDMARLLLVPKEMLPRIALPRSPSFRKQSESREDALRYMRERLTSSNGRLLLSTPLQMSLLYDVTGIYGLHVEDLGDDSLDHLRAVPDLRHLELRRGNITARGLECLQHCPGLTHLDVHHVPIGSEELKIIARSKNLVALKIRRPLLNDAGLGMLAGLPLQELYLPNANISSAGVAELKYLRELMTLQLDSSPLHDRGVKALCELSDLRRLSLRSVGITDAALLALPRLTSLEQLDLSHNEKLTDGAVQKLRRAMPRCKISFNDNIPWNSP